MAARSFVLSAALLCCSLLASAACQESDEQCAALYSLHDSSSMLQSRVKPVHMSEVIIPSPALVPPPAPSEEEQMEYGQVKDTLMEMDETLGIDFDRQHEPGEQHKGIMVGSANQRFLLPGEEADAEIEMNQEFSVDSSDAEGKSCCASKCKSDGDCAANLFCCPAGKICMDRSTGSTVGKNCKACGGRGLTNGPPAPPPPSTAPTPGSGKCPSRPRGTKCCAQGCASSSDCAPGLFCCGGKRMCMGRDTGTTGGSNCAKCHSNRPSVRKRPRSEPWSSANASQRVNGLKAELWLVKAKNYVDFSTLGLPNDTRVDEQVVYLKNNKAVPAFGVDKTQLRQKSKLSKQELNQHPLLGKGSPTINQNHVAGRWTGWLEIKNEGDYTFSIESDDGGRLSLDGEQWTIDNGGTRACNDRHWVKGEMQIKCMTKRMSIGAHSVLIEWYNDCGFNGIVFRYRGPDTVNMTEGYEGRAGALVPKEVLVAKNPGPLALTTTTTTLAMLPGSGLNAKFWYDQGKLDRIPSSMAGKTPSLTRVDKEINYVAIESEWPGFQKGKVDNFIAEWEGYLYVTNPGTYLFMTESDDGSKVYIDGNMVVNNGGLHAMQIREGSVVLPKGEVKILVRFIEAGGGAGMIFKVSGPDTNNHFSTAAVMFRTSPGGNPVSSTMLPPAETPPSTSQTPPVTQPPPVTGPPTGSPPVPSLTPPMQTIAPPATPAKECQITFGKNPGGGEKCVSPPGNKKPSCSSDAGDKGKRLGTSKVQRQNPARYDFSWDSKQGKLCAKRIDKYRPGGRWKYPLAIKCLCTDA